ncbi:MAG TPA: S-layer protein [Porphyromonadaceae bacterium]|nr:S-layer protein [Porphyromonadaceae bacterium]HBX45879.1 S-layer protein [Porphyromonadaceae bacterium]
MKRIYFLHLTIMTIFLVVFVFSACGTKEDSTPPWEWEDPEKPDPGTDDDSKPRFIWIDASANFPDFADNKDNIRRDLTLAKEAGFTHIVVDVRPPTGDVLFSTTKADQVEWLGAWVNGVYTKVTRTATWDYLQAFIDIGHELGLKVFAGVNTMVGGHKTSLGGSGILFRDASKKAWATQLLTTSGIQNAMDVGREGTRFFNPANMEVQNFLLGLLEDLAAYSNLDGIILDRARFDELDSDFSDESRIRFESYLGKSVSFPEDVMRGDIKTAYLPADLPPYFKQWLEFRVKVIHDFMEKARTRVKAKNPDISFGVYVGGWYSQYYGVGVNWASPKYNTSTDYPQWAGANYQKYGFADLMDVILIGAYAAPNAIYGTSEWTVQGFCSRAKNLIKGEALVVGGPDVGNYGWGGGGDYSDPIIYSAVTNSVDAAINSCDGYFLFDMIHLKLMPQKWQRVKQGIDNYLKTTAKNQ